jgi:hypothetical protein
MEQYLPGPSIRPPEQTQTRAMFADFPGRADYIDDPDFFSVSGLDKIMNKRVSVTQRAVKRDDTAFVVAYPSAGAYPRPLFSST